MVILLSKNIIFWCAFLQDFHIWDKVFKSELSKFFKGCLPQNLLSPLLNTLSHFETVLHSSKGNKHKGIKTKSLSLKIQEATSKNVATNEENEKQYVRQIIYIFMCQNKCVLKFEFRFPNFRIMCFLSFATIFLYGFCVSWYSHLRQSIQEWTK